MSEPKTAEMVQLVLHFAPSIHKKMVFPRKYEPLQDQSKEN